MKTTIENIDFYSRPAVAGKRYGQPNYPFTYHDKI